MTKKNNQVTYKTKVKREFYRIRQICVKKMYEKRYSVKEIAQTLATSEQQIYHDIRKIKTEIYLDGGR